MFYNQRDSVAIFPHLQVFLLATRVAFGTCWLRRSKSSSEKSTGDLSHFQQAIAYPDTHRPDDRLAASELRNCTQLIREFPHLASEVPKPAARRLKIGYPDAARGKHSARQLPHSGCSTGMRPWKVGSKALRVQQLRSLREPSKKYLFQEVRSTLLVECRSTSNFNGTPRTTSSLHAITLGGSITRRKSPEFK